MCGCEEQLRNMTGIIIIVKSLYVCFRRIDSKRRVREINSIQLEYVSIIFIDL